MHLSTSTALKHAAQAGVHHWGEYHYERKWFWAGHVARRPEESWIWKVTTWRDAQWGYTVSALGCDRPLRPSRRRWMKWEDTLRRFCLEYGLGAWVDFAKDRTTWSDWMNVFCG